MKKLYLLLLLALASCGQFPLPKNSEATENPLHDLEWLIGTWQDESDEVEVKIVWNWDNNKHFLQQSFDVEGEDGNHFTGRQVLGWDPAAKQVHSWIFDSLGGFGESEWRQEGDRWYAETIYTMGDGKKATATHIYRKLDRNSYTFSSEGRDIDGEVMPNIGPFKMVRSES